MDGAPRGGSRKSVAATPTLGLVLCCLRLATLGGEADPAQEAARLVEQAGGIVAGVGFVIELTFLNGRSKLGGRDVFSLLQYDK